MTPNHRPEFDPCDKGHDLCESAGLHIRGRCKNGCAQFQDGSWLNKNVCWEEHPGLPAGMGDGAAVQIWLEGTFADNRRRWRRGV